MADVTLPSEGEIWRHSKGTRYRIISIGHDTRDGNAVVIYESTNPTDTTGMWVRPLGEFLGFNENHQRRFVREDQY